MVKRLKIGDSFDLSYDCRSDWDSCNTYLEMANEFMTKYLEYREKSEKKRISFWRKVLNQIKVPAKGHLSYDSNLNSVTVLKNDNSNKIGQAELERLELELRIKQLKKNVGDKK